MNVSQEHNKSGTQVAESRFIIVANIYLSKKKKTVKILDLDGHLLGIALRDEILALLAGKISHVNVVIYRQGVE
jgi:hypothetical protein